MRESANAPGESDVIETNTAPSGGIIVHYDMFWAGWFVRCFSKGCSLAP
jgi:hypothetical protein